MCKVSGFRESNCFLLHGLLEATTNRIGRFVQCSGLNMLAPYRTC